MPKKHSGQHVMSHQHGYRVVVHDLNGKRVRAGNWIVTAVSNPLIINHDEDPAEEAAETPAQEAAEEVAGQS